MNQSLLQSKQQYSSIKYLSSIFNTILATVSQSFKDDFIIVVLASFLYLHSYVI